MEFHQEHENHQGHQDQQEPRREFPENLSKVDIKQLLIEAFDLEMKVEDLKDDMPLFREGLELDSIDILEVFYLMDKKYRIKIKREEINQDHFQNIGSLCSFLSSGALSIKEKL